MRNEMRNRGNGFVWQPRVFVLACLLASLGLGGSLAAQATLASVGTSTAGISAGTPILAATVKTHFDNLYGNDTAINAQLAKLSSSNWTFTAGTPAMLGYTGGNFGIGEASPGRAFVLKANRTDYVAHIENDNDTKDGHGLVIHAGSSSGVAGAVLIGFWTRSGIQMGSIMQGSGATVAYNTSSDRRLKENIADTRYTIADLMKIQVRDFNFISDMNKSRVTGFIAQELAPIVPEAVSIPAKESDTWAVDYGKLTPILVKAVQDQQKHIDSLQAENTELKKRLMAIEQKLVLK